MCLCCVIKKTLRLTWLVKLQCFCFQFTVESVQREVQAALAMLDTLQEHRDSRQQAVAAQAEQLHAQTDDWRAQMYTYIKVRYTRSLCVKPRAARFPHARPN